MLSSDHIFLAEPPKLHKLVQTVSAHKFIKDNKKQLPKLPACANTDTKLKQNHFIAFPAILPLVTGYHFEEGPMDCEEVAIKFEDLHPLHEDWLHLNRNTYRVDEIYLDLDTKYPLPSRVGAVSHSADLPIKVLIKRARQNDAYDTCIKNVEAFRESARNNRA